MTAVRLSDTERLLALDVVHLLEEVHRLRYALADVGRALGGELGESVSARLFPEDIVAPDGTVLARCCQAPAPPMPQSWLTDMANGRSLAQAAGSRERAEEVLARR